MSLPFSGSRALEGAAPGLCVCVQGRVPQPILNLPVEEPGAGVLCVRALFWMMAQEIYLMLLKWHQRILGKGFMLREYYSRLLPVKFFPLSLKL